MKPPRTDRPRGASPGAKPPHKPTRPHGGGAGGGGGASGRPSYAGGAEKPRFAGGDTGRPRFGGGGGKPQANANRGPSEPARFRPERSEARPAQAAAKPFPADRGATLSKAVQPAPAETQRGPQRPPARAQDRVQARVQDRARESLTRPGACRRAACDRARGSMAATGGGQTLHAMRAEAPTPRAHRLALRPAMPSRRHSPIRRGACGGWWSPRRAPPPSPLACPSPGRVTRGRDGGSRPHRPAARARCRPSGRRFARRPAAAADPYWPPRSSWPGPVPRARIRSPIRAISAPSCARPPLSGSPPSSCRSATRRKRPARSPKPPRARWRRCRCCGAVNLARTASSC